LLDVVDADVEFRALRPALMCGVLKRSERGSRLIT
jgi:hypothetical protein